MVCKFCSGKHGATRHDTRRPCIKIDTTRFCSGVAACKVHVHLDLVPFFGSQTFPESLRHRFLLFVQQQTLEQNSQTRTHLNIFEEPPVASKMMSLNLAQTSTHLAGATLRPRAVPQVARRTQIVRADPIAPKEEAIPGDVIACKLHNGPYLATHPDHRKST